MSDVSNSHSGVAQLIDANLDRAREGLRVIEDWCRFVIKKKDLVIALKNWRQELGCHHHEIYKQARSTSTDQGLGLRHPAQETRNFPQGVIAANFGRAQEALRVLEEFARATDPKLAESASKIRYGLYELEITVLKANIYNFRHEKLLNCKICLITSPKADFSKTIILALEAGVDMVQYRCKESNDMQRLAEAKELSSICKSFGALFIINDRIDIALASEADGVHLGQDDLPTKTARKLLGNERLIGRSTHSIKQLKNAQEEGCDYLGVGPVHSTKTKPELKPLGLNYVSEVSKTTHLPWFAIGGVNASNLNSVRAAGAKKIAISNAIMNAKDPSLASLELLKELS